MWFPHNTRRLTRHRLSTGLLTPRLARRRAWVGITVLRASLCPTPQMRGRTVWPS